MRIEANYKNLERASSWIVNADAKTSFILAFNGVVFAYLMSKGPDIKAILFKQWTAWQSIILLAVSVLFLIFFILSIRNCFRAINPSIDGQIPSVFYFGTIQSLGLEKFRQKIKSLDEEGIEEELINQTFVVSTIAYKKFTSARRALNHLMLSLLFWVGVLITLNFV